MRLALAAAGASLALVACGRATGGTSPTSAAAARDSTTSASRANPCGLLAPAEVARAFGVAAPPGIRTAGECTYKMGPHDITVTITPVSAQLEQAVNQPLTKGQERVTGHGYTGVARELRLTVDTYILPVGRQAEVSLVKSGAYLDIVLSDDSKKAGTLLSGVTTLGQLAASRL